MDHINKQAFDDIIAKFRKLYPELVQMRIDWNSSSAFENLSRAIQAITREITNGEVPTEAKEALKKMQHMTTARGWQIISERNG
eukprot:455936-Karenia_brevis.AAC.1